MMKDIISPLYPCACPYPTINYQARFLGKCHIYRHIRNPKDEATLSKCVCVNFNPGSQSGR